MVRLNVVDEVFGVVVLCWRGENDASYAFFQRGSQCVDYGFVKVV